MLMRAIYASLAAAVVACSPAGKTTTDSATTATSGDAPSAAGCARTPEDAKAQVVQLEERWEEAFYRRDSSFFSRALGDDFVVAGGRTTGSKRDYIADMMKGPPVPDSIAGVRPPAEEVRALTRDVVVASGVWTDRSAPTNTGAYTEIFVCRNGQVDRQSTATTTRCHRRAAEASVRAEAVAFLASISP
jgi:hypothetical protein